MYRVTQKLRYEKYLLKKKFSNTLSSRYILLRSRNSDMKILPIHEVLGVAELKLLSFPHSSTSNFRNYVIKLLQIIFFLVYFLLLRIFFKNYFYIIKSSQRNKSVY